MRSVDIIRTFRNSPKYENYNLVFNFYHKESDFFIVQCEIDNDTLFVTECRKSKAYVAIEMQQINEYVKYFLSERVICIVDKCDINLTNKILAIDEENVNLLDTERYEIKNKHIIDKENKLILKLNNHTDHFYVDDVYFCVIFQDMRGYSKNLN